MQTVILIVHLILALCLIGIVLLQRNEGGGLGMGGGAVTGRAPATPLGRLTWFFAVCFICTSLFLTILAARNAAGTSVVDRIGSQAPAAAEETVPEDTAPSLPEGQDLLPPAPVTQGDAPLLPPRAD